MKKLLHVSLIILLGFFVSCSEEDNSDLSIDDIYGVWEQESYTSNSSGQRLIFEFNIFEEVTSDNVACIISRTVYSEDAIVSGIGCYSWEINNNEVIIYEEDLEVVATYILNSENQLISENPEDAPFYKISDTTDGYF